MSIDLKRNLCLVLVPKISLNIYITINDCFKRFDILSKYVRSSIHNPISVTSKLTQLLALISIIGRYNHNEIIDNHIIFMMNLIFFAANIGYNVNINPIMNHFSYDVWLKISGEDICFHVNISKSI